MNSNNEKKISSSKDNIENKPNSEISKLENIYYIIDYKNKLEHQKANKDGTFTFQRNFIDEDSLNQSIVSTNNNSGSNKIDSNTEKIISQFIKKLFQKNSTNWFHICTKISSQFFQKSEGKYDKDKLENSVNYLYSNQENYSKLNYVKIDLEFVQNFGYILMASYSIFKSYKINDKKDLRINIKHTLREKTNVISDFLEQNKGKNSNRKKTVFWDKNSRNYYIPGIYIFLINTFKEIENIEINFEEYNSAFSEEDFELFAIFVYNLEIIFSKINSVKLNLNNKTIQQNLYNKASDDLMYKLKKINNNMKYRIINFDNIYNTKWDFKSDFLNVHLRTIPVTNTIQESKGNLNTSNSENKMNISTNTDNNETKIINEYITNEALIENQILNYTKMILLCIYNLNKIKEINNMNLIINNSYSEEISHCFKKNSSESDDLLILSKIKEFHLLDLFLGKLIKLNTVNWEFNSLDCSTFTQIIKFIYVNNNLTSLNISFFSSDVFYLQQSLYKLYNYFCPDTELNLHCDIEKNILDKILPPYTLCVKNFFETLKTKNLQNLGICMDIPDIIENNKKYILLMTKFFINIILYIFNKENNKLETAKILCPKLILNNEYYPFIDKIFSEIKKHGCNNNIKELSIQGQLYKVINIKNILCETLNILNIGSCDMVTFKSLIYYVASYKFSKNSNLKKLSLGLIKSIRRINKELEYLLIRVFSVKMKQLIELNIYSNITINKKEEYFDFLKIFKNSCISKCTFILNENSEDVINLKECIEKRNNIKYLITFNSEKENVEQNNNSDISEIFWILKYLFQKNFSPKKAPNSKDSLFIFLVNNILSYNYSSKNMIIQHYINEIN